MSTKPLIETNPYLKDPKTRRKMFYTNVVSSTAIEGVRKAVINALEPFKNPKTPLAIDENEKSDESQK
jgi:hypothetical protein